MYDYLDDCARDSISPTFADAWNSLKSNPNDRIIEIMEKEVRTANSKGDEVKHTKIAARQSYYRAIKASLQF